MRLIQLLRILMSGRVLPLCSAFLLLALPLPGQSTNAAAPVPLDAAKLARVSDALRRVDHDDVGYGSVDAQSFVELAAKAGPAAAIPVLERFFDRQKDADTKIEVAAVLVWLGDKNPAFWELLVQQATLALQFDAPSPFMVTTSPTAPETDLSPEFLAWAKAHQLSPAVAFRLYREAARNLVPLAKSGDPRGAPYLLQALRSSDIGTQGTASAGLAQIHDPRFIPVIIDACRRAPPRYAHFLADDLIYFEDPRADAVFSEYFPGENLNEIRKFRGAYPFLSPEVK